jgi:signal transduction histidine kinase
LLVRANEGLDESNQVKDKLFSILGHDLRSPFVSVINLLEIIDDDEIPAELRKQMLDELSVTSKASLDTLTNLLKWGEMQIKGIRINQRDFALKPLVERVIQLLAGIAQNKQITIADDTQSLSLYADPDHIEFVLRNLLSNAIKFTGAGGSVSISSTYDEHKHEVTIAVKDSGVGIAPERLQEIFSLENVSRDGTYNEKGTSLGLMMCKEFTEVNNGRIEVNSIPGQGSSFSIVLKGSVEKKTSGMQFA